MSQASVHHPSSYGFPGMVGLPTTVTGGSSATFSFKGLKPSVGHTITWAGGTPTTNAVTADAGGLASQAHTYPAGPGTYTMYVVETSTGRRFAQRTIVLPYSGAGGFAPMSAPPPENGEGEPEGDGEVQQMQRAPESEPEPEPEPESEPEVSDAPVGFDPSAHTIAEVQEHVENNPEQAEDVLIAEEEGKNRITLVTWLENFTTED